MRGSSSGWVPIIWRTPASMSPKLTEDDFSRNHAVGHPLAFGVERLQNDVEVFSQVRQNVIMIVRVPLVC